MKPLESEKALDKGGVFVAESFLLLVASSLVMWEYTLKKSEDAVKKSKKRERQQFKEGEKQALMDRIAAIERRLDETERAAAARKGVVALVKSASASVPAPGNSASDDMGGDNRVSWWWRMFGMSSQWGPSASTSSSSAAVEPSPSNSNSNSTAGGDEQTAAARAP